VDTASGTEHDQTNHHNTRPKDRARHDREEDTNAQQA